VGYNRIVFWVALREFMLKVVLFLILVSLPLGLFGAYTGLVRKWTFRRLTPYAVVYIGGVAALLGTAMQIRGLYLVLAVAVCMLGTWIGMKSWAKAFDK